MTREGCKRPGHPNDTKPCESKILADRKLEGVFEGVGVQQACSSRLVYHVCLALPISHEQAMPKNAYGNLEDAAARPAAFEAFCLYETERW